MIPEPLRLKAGATQGVKSWQKWGVIASLKTRAAIQKKGMDAATPAALSESSKISFLKKKGKKKTAFQASLSREDEVLAYYNT